MVTIASDFYPLLHCGQDRQWSPSLTSLFGSTDYRLQAEPYKLSNAFPAVVQKEEKEVFYLSRLEIGN